MSVQVQLRRVQGHDQSRLRFEPSLPRLAKAPPVGAGWIHEIKHDGFRIIARREGDRVRLLTRTGYDFSALSAHRRRCCGFAGGIVRGRRRSHCLR